MIDRIKIVAPPTVAAEVLDDIAYAQAHLNAIGTDHLRPTTFAEVTAPPPPPLTFTCEFGNGWTFCFSNIDWAIRHKHNGAGVRPNRELVGADFADFGDRKLLAELGYFSVDLPKHRAKREAQATEKRYLEEAYEAIGLNRDEQHNLIAAKMEATKIDGIWAKSTGEYARACRRLDESTLRLNPAIAQSVAELKGN